MGFTKTSNYTATQNELAAIAKALAHPARIAILELLMKRPCICGDIVEELPIAQASVSQHLKALKQADLIKGEIEGPKTCYGINPEGWKAASTWINFFLQKGKDCC